MKCEEDASFFATKLIWVGKSGYISLEQVKSTRFYSNATGSATLKINSYCSVAIRT